VWQAARWRYGAKKVWKQLNRETISVARCTVERLMDDIAMHGVVRGRRVRTTIPDALADRPLDLVQRNFTATRPNQLWVSDLTYVATWAGFVYVAFVTDAFSHRIVGWRASKSLRAISRSTRWSKRSTIATPTARSCTTATEARNILPFATRTGCSTPASNPRWGAAAMRTTTRSLKRSTVCTRPK
jgi:hypothetical protein